jgi:hypothetical protein
MKAAEYFFAMLLKLDFGVDDSPLNKSWLNSGEWLVCFELSRL